MAEGESLPEQDLAVAYQLAVRSEIRDVLARKECAEQAQLIAAGLERAAGVDGALRILIETAAVGASSGDGWM
jgi:hypothetical protein